jgi:hypothetical protein
MKTAKEGSKYYKTAKLAGDYVAVKYVKTAMGDDWFTVTVIGGRVLPLLYASAEFTDFCL